MPGKADVYSNLILTTFNMSAADTLTFQEIDLGISLFENIGLLIEKIEYIPSVETKTLLVAAADRIRFGLTNDNGISSISADDRRIIDFMELGVGGIVGAVVSSFLEVKPYVHDFTMLGGGGLIVAPRPLYAWMMTDGLGAVMGLVMRLYFRVLRLSSNEYIELLEARRFPA